MASTLFDLVLLLLCIKSCYHFKLFSWWWEDEDDHSQSCPAITPTPSQLLCFLSLLLLPGSEHSRTVKGCAGPRHSAPRSWHERDFCLMNLPTSRSRGYRGTRLDRKRLAREVMLSRWPPLLMSSALVPGGQGDSPLASRTAHSRSSGVRWSSEAEISRYRELKRAALDMASYGGGRYRTIKQQLFTSLAQNLNLNRSNIHGESSW